MRAIKWSWYYDSLEDESKREARAGYYSDKLEELLDEGMEFTEAKRIADEYADSVMKKAYEIPDFTDENIPW